MFFSEKPGFGNRVDFENEYCGCGVCVGRTRIDRALKSGWSALCRPVLFDRHWCPCPSIWLPTCRSSGGRIFRMPWRDAVLHDLAGEVEFAAFFPLLEARVLVKSGKQS